MAGLDCLQLRPARVLLKGCEFLWDGDLYTVTSAEVRVGRSGPYLKVEASSHYYREPLSVALELDEEVHVLLLS